ncbi:chitobiase/beta-hexosaminidase C-terminal domain-containing protein [Nakamurella sp.]|uniref:chitobiase/beta-hexosaminidase C-terminal domain-containing protein n=1 Tax=Nakamurella sp. TaxID=1869182 RepID=UPI00378392F6
MTYPVDFPVPTDSGGPGAGSPIGGFGGNPQADRDAHRAAVAELAKAPVLLVHGNGGAADVRPWDLLDQRRFLRAAGYGDEIIWAPSYLGSGSVDLQTPHTNNIDDLRSYLDAVCTYLDVEVVDVIAHSLGCTLTYALARGLKRQTSPIVWDRPKKWRRLGTFVSLAGAFHGLGTGSLGEWVTGGAFMTGLLAETEGGGGETPFGAGDPPTDGEPPHTITYFCATAAGDFVDAQNPGTGRLDGAVNRSYNLGSGTQGHQAIKESQAVFDDFRPLLNSVPPAPPVELTLQPGAGAQPPGVDVTVTVDPDRDVTVTAERVVTVFTNGFLDRTVQQTLTANVRTGGGLTLTDPGVWEVSASADGATPQRATYWVGVRPVEVDIVTDNAEPFENSLLVTATSTSQVATIYHSLDGQRWTPGASVTINSDAVVSFVAIDPNGVASTVAARQFTKAIPWDDQVTGTVIDHFVAGRIDVDEFLAYADQFGFFAPFTLYLVGGDWVLDPSRPAAPAPARAAGAPVAAHPGSLTIVVPADAQVRYTLDGSVPTDTSAGFTGPTQLVVPSGSGRRVVVYRVTDPDMGVRFGAVPLADN